MGRWLAIGSELPCSVIVLLFIGQLIGTSIGGAQGGMFGALIGALVGFAFGSYSVFVTVRFYERLEKQTATRRPYMPSMDEILEEPEFLKRGPHDEDV